MFTENNIQRIPLKTEIKTVLNSDIGIPSFSILIETSSRMSGYNVVIKTFITQIQKAYRDSQIQIITYGDSANTIFEFDSEPMTLKDSLKDIKFPKDKNEEAKLGEAMRICYNNIESNWSSDLMSKIIIISSGESTDDSSNDLVNILNLDNYEIYGLAGGNATKSTNEAVTDLESLLPDKIVIPLGKNPSQDIRVLMNGRANGASSSSSSNDYSIECPVNIEVYPHTNETKSIKEDLQLDVVIKTDGNTSLVPAGTKILFQACKYFCGYTIQLKDNLKFGEPYEETIKLEFKRGHKEKSQFENFPSKIFFKILLANQKEDVHEGYVELNISYFLGDLKSKYRCCIGVEGDIGNGKSTCLNGFVNLFNPYNQIEEYFIANRSSDTHVTTSINNTSLKEILSSKHCLHPVQESFHDIDIAWSDAWGFIDTDVPLKHKAEGKIHHGTKKDDCIISHVDERYCIDCFIFIVSVRNYTNISAMQRIEKKIKEVIALKITPLLAITFTDVLSKNQLQDIMRNKVAELSVQECNTFIINNYTEKDTHKDIAKDIQYLRLLTKAVQLCIIRKEKNEMDQAKGISNLSINDSIPNNSTPIKSQSSFFESSSSPSPVFFKSPTQQISTTTSSSTSTQSPISSSINYNNNNNNNNNNNDEPIKIINVTIDVIPDSNGTVLTSFEIESSSNESLYELKCKLINEIDPQMNANDWSITRETGSILSESRKLSTVINLSDNSDEIKLILKKKQRLLL
ncbi:hypothetical protein ACTFIU_006097 [Dictyostelium citrinum]